MIYDDRVSGVSLLKLSLGKIPLFGGTVGQ